MLKKIIPSYARIPLIIVVVWNFSVYFGARCFTQNRIHYRLNFDFEQYIPFLPWTITIYLGCYLFWIVNYILATRYDKQRAYCFVLVDLFGKSICFLLYILIPTTMDRAIILDTMIWAKITKHLYEIDAADNLFPSIHCFVSWLCFIGIRFNTKIANWYKGISLVIAIAICISTLTIKQHVVLDVVAGIALAEIMYWFCKKIFLEGEYYVS